MKPTAFLVDKPEGMGSTDVVRHFKRNLPKPFKKIGHFGTLDPFATGLLIIGINGAQRLADYLHSDYPKTYRAKGKLGVLSSTGDKTGELLEQELPDLSSLDSKEQELKWLELFTKDYAQSPPAYSAAKHKGKNLYEYAREGILIEKEKVSKTIHSFKILNWDLPYIEFEVTVGSGTYIRVLFEDMAISLATVGHLETLRRVKIGPHSVDQAGALEQWPANAIDVEGLYEAKEIILNKPELELKYRNGMKLNAEEVARHLGDGETGWVKSAQGELLGLAERVGVDLKVLFNFPQNN